MPALHTETSDAALEAQVFWLRYRREIAGFVLVLMLALLGFSVYRFYRERRETAAANAFAGAKTAADYQQVIDTYGDTPSAAAAFLLLADEQRKSGKPAEANATLQRFLDRFPRHELASTARMSIAANLQTMGKQDEALAAYQQVASSAPDSFNAPLALLEQAQLLQARNRADDARHVCETIMTRYPGSYAAAEAARLLGTLPAPVVAASPPGKAPAINISPTPATTASPPKPQ